MFDRIRFEVKLWAGERQEKVAMWVAWALPRRVALWAFIRVMAHATQGPYGTDHIDDITYKKAHDRWEAGPHPVSGDPIEDDDFWVGSVADPIAVPNESA